MSNKVTTAEVHNTSLFVNLSEGQMFQTSTTGPVCIKTYNYSRAWAVSLETGKSMSMDGLDTVTVMKNPVTITP